MTGIILAGGKGRRMGHQKLFLEAAGIPLFERVYTVLDQLFTDIIVVTNRPEWFHGYPIRIVTDIFPDRGALGGLYTGLKYTSNEAGFCFAADMPFLNVRLIRFMIQKWDKGDVIIPRTSHGLQPLHAIYSRRCLGPIKNLLLSGRLKIIDFFREVDVIYISERDILEYDPMLLSFLNINTKEDLWRAERILSTLPCTDSR